MGEGEPASAGALGPGSKVAGYRLEERIGAGGMAVIFRAQDERLGRPVALKVLAPALGADEAFRQRFIRESRAAATVDDPHIIPVFEAGEASGVLFIAMRYVPGGDAGSLLHRGGPLPPERVAAIVSPVASALDAAHSAGLVHRDVKPSNMLMDVRPGRPDHVYLSDFGLSKAALGANSITGAGQFLGTLDYIAPEQIEGKAVDGAADQYSLACAAYELLTGAPPFPREQPAAVIYAQLSEPPPPLGRRRPGLPGAADQVFARAMAKAPADRYPSCWEFADALRTSFGLSPYAAAPGAPPPAGPARPPTQLAGPVAGPPVAVAPPGPEPGATQAIYPSGPLGAPAAVAAATPPTVLGAGAGRGPAGPAGTRSGDPPGPGGRGPAPARRRRAVLIGGAAAVVAAACVLAAVLLNSKHSPPVRQQPAAGAALKVSVTAKSGLTPVSGYVYVGYQAGKLAAAQITGQVSGAAAGEVAALYEQEFPYARPPAQIGSVILHPSGTAKSDSFHFTVSPELATRYTVRVFRSSTSHAVLSTSAPASVYVATYTKSTAARTCQRPVCHETFRVRVFVPPAAMASEIGKIWYPYFGLRTGPGKAPAAPRTQVLYGGSPRVAASYQVSGSEFRLTISYTFRIGNQAYSWNWSACSKDSEAENGIGLPGHHGCGDSRIATDDVYNG